MGLTFGVIAVFALLLLAVGLLMTRNVRWAIPLVETPMPPRLRGNEFFLALSVIALAVTVGALLWIWGLVALPH